MIAVVGVAEVRKEVSDASIGALEEEGEEEAEEEEDEEGEEKQGRGIHLFI